MEDLLNQISELESRLAWRKQFLAVYMREAKFWYKRQKDLEEELELLIDLLNKANGELRQTIQK